MKRIGSFIVTSFVLFWSYFVSSFLCLMLLQTFLRLLIDADSRGEYLWKTLVMYAWMVMTCVLQLRVTASTHKPGYLAYMQGKEWSLRETVTYILKNTDFWLSSIGFAIWPVLVPQLFGAILRLYVSAEFLSVFPRAILALPTVSLPIMLLSAVGWVIVLRSWCMNRIHKG